MHNLTKSAASVLSRLYSTAMAKQVLVFLPIGAEEMEFVISVDVLRRGGIDVTVAGLPDKNTIKCSRGVSINPDLGIDEVQFGECYDAMVLPGGLGGSKMLAESETVGKLLKQQEESGRLIAAICAAPTALKAHGIGLGKRVTSYPSVEECMTEGGKYTYEKHSVVTDEGLITSRGPGTAYHFALAVLENLAGKQKAQEVAKGMLVDF